MLRRRLELHDEVYNRRLKREQYAKQRAGLIKRYIGKTSQPHTRSAPFRLSPMFAYSLIVNSTACAICLIDI
jgi:hypothetical protein